MKITLKHTLLTAAVITLVVYSGFRYETHNRHNHVHHDHSDVYHDHSHSSAVKLPERLLFPTQEPDRVILNLNEDPHTTLSMNWRTDTTVAEGFVEYAVATAGPEFKDLAK